MEEDIRESPWQEDTFPGWETGETKPGMTSVYPWQSLKTVSMGKGVHPHGKMRVKRLLCENNGIYSVKKLLFTGVLCGVKNQW